MQQTFGAANRPCQAFFPDGEVLTHTYGTHGLLTSLISSLGQTLVNGVQYTALGQVKQYDLGGGSSAGRVRVRGVTRQGGPLDIRQHPLPSRCTGGY